MRTAIIDDEPLAREELHRLLRAHKDINIVGEATNGPEALDLIQRERPDLVLLDIEMPGMTGFEVLEKLTCPMPAVIVTTAYEDFAIRAFRANAIDYLLKPIEPVALAESLKKVFAEAAPTAAAPQRARLKAEDKVFVRDGSRCWFVKLANVRLIESDGNYSRLFFGNDKPMIYRTLKMFEEVLDPAVFFRANRYQIINLSAVEKVEFDAKDELVATLSCGTRVEMSRRMGQQFREQMGI